jgi:hypothetical protein
VILERLDEEAGDGTVDDEGEGCEDEASHPCVYEDAEKKRMPALKVAITTG